MQQANTPPLSEAMDAENRCWWCAEDTWEGIARLIEICRVPAHADGIDDIDGIHTAANMAAEVFTACRAGEERACWLVAQWLHFGAMHRLEHYADVLGLGLYGDMPFDLDLRPYLP